MRAKEFLDNIVRLRKTIDRKKARIRVLEEIATNTSSTLTGMPRNPSPTQSTMADAVCKIIDIENEITALEKKRDEPINVLHRMENDTFSTILLLRYVKERTWEDICDEIGYGRSQTFCFHNQAIEALEAHMK